MKRHARAFPVPAAAPRITAQVRHLVNVVEPDTTSRAIDAGYQRVASLCAFRWESESKRVRAGEQAYLLMGVLAVERFAVERFAVERLAVGRAC
eukprot:76952-Pleurochrysis_carterae.AAC.3